jgi:hypothetical protein
MTTVTAPSPVGSYPVTASGAVDANYTISYVAGILTVTPVALTVTANNQSKAYGAALPILTVSYSGFVNGDTSASLTTQPTVTTTATAASHVAGNPYPINATGAADANYTIGYVPGTVTVTPIPLTITANSRSIVYGSALPVLTVGYTGFVNGDTSSSLTIPPTVTTSASASPLVGSYPITPIAASDLDYTFIYVAGTLTVTPAPLTITADSLTKTNGQTVTFAGTEFTTSVLVIGDTVTSVTLTSLGATNTATIAGSPYPIVPTNAVGIGLANYTITYINGKLIVIPPMPIITWAAPVPIGYGEALSTNQLNATANVSGSFVYDPTNGAVLNAGTNILTTAFNPSSNTAGYSSVTDVVCLVVSNTLLTVAAQSTTRIYGATNPVFTVTFSGFTNGDTASALEGEANFTTTAATNSSIGIYSIVPSLGTLAASNYTFVGFADGLLTVTAAPLTVTANSTNRPYGTANPNFTATLSGFVNGDPPSVVGGQPDFATAATIASSVGTYPITPAVGTLSAANYTFAPFVNGLLTVQRATPIVTWTSPAPIIYGTPLSANQLNATANVPGGFTYNPTNGAEINTGTNTLSVVFMPTDTTDYISVTNTVNQAVSPAALTVTANNTNRYSAQANPVFTDTIIGLTNGDNITVTNTTTATSSSPVGLYPITPSLVDPSDRETNYVVNLIPGTLTILSLPETVSFTYPTTNNGVYVSTSNSVSVSGTVSDQLSVIEVTWAESPAGGGTANGTTNWSIPAVALSTGSNVVTVKAFDSAANSASATITIIYTSVSQTASFGGVGIIGGNLTATLQPLLPGATVVLQASSDLKNWIPVQTNAVSGTSLPITYPINPALGDTFLRAIVQ